jgi:MYXO-CTERM domain-containing protein
LAGSLMAAEANAYCRTAACDGGLAGQLCVPTSPSDCGNPLFWGKPCMGFSVFSGGSDQIDVDTLETLVVQAFAAWEQADCDSGTRPRMEVHNLGRVVCDQPEYNQSGGNTNLVIVRDGPWPYLGQAKTLALTTVTYSLDDGEIYDTDLEVNGGPDVDLTTGDGDVHYDLLSILTHETGHMLGLAHSDVDGATMEVEYIAGDVSLRTLDPDDAAGICAAYPPGDIGTCDPTPRHGFKATCGPEPPEEGCGCASAPSQTRLGWVAILLGLVGVLGWRANRRPRRRA